MLSWLSLSLIAAVLASLLVGGMVFFAAVTAPMVFAKLEPAVAGRFIRQMFPVYYLVMLVLSALAAAAAATAERPADAIVLAVAALGFVLARQGLMPAINRLRDREIAGDEAAGRLFGKLHGVSVWLNLAQLVAATVILVRLILAA